MAAITPSSFIGFSDSSSNIKPPGVSNNVKKITNLPFTISGNNFNHPPPPLLVPNMLTHLNTCCRVAGTTLYLSGSRSLRLAGSAYITLKATCWSKENTPACSKPLPLCISCSWDPQVTSRTALDLNYSEI